MVLFISDNEIFTSKGFVDTRTIVAGMQKWVRELPRVTKEAQHLYGYKNGSVSELKISENSDWTPEKIEERGLDMLKFMESRWNFKFKSKEDKLALILPLKS